MNYAKFVLLLFCLQQSLIGFPLLNLEEKSVPANTSNKNDSINISLTHILKKSKWLQNKKKYVEAFCLIVTHLNGKNSISETQALSLALADVHYSWAEDLIKKEKYSEAIEHLEKTNLMYNLFQPEKSADILNRIAYLYYKIGKNDKALELSTFLPSKYQAIGDRVGEASAIKNLANLCYELKQIPQALEYYKKASSLFQAIGNRSEVASISNAMGFVYSKSPDQKDLALSYYKKALQIYEEMDDKAMKIIVISNLGILYGNLGQKQEELESYFNALLLSKESGNKEGQKAMLENIGLTYSGMGHTQKSLEYFEKSLTIELPSHNLPKDGYILNNIGLLFLKLGQMEKAKDAFNQGLAIWHNLGHYSNIATTYNNLGSVCLDLEQFSNAMEYFNQALHNIRGDDKLALKSRIYNNMGSLYLKLGRNREAMSYLEKAIHLSRVGKDPVVEAMALNNIGNIYNHLGQKKQAIEFLEKALKLFPTENNHEKIATLYNNIGALKTNSGQHETALKYLEKSLKVRKENGDKIGEKITLSNVGISYYILGDKKKASDYFEKAFSDNQIITNTSIDAAFFNNIATLDISQKPGKTVLNFLNRSLHISQTKSNKENEAITLNNLASLHFVQGRYKKALDYYQKAVSISQTGENSISRHTIFVNIGILYYYLGQKQRGLEYCEKAWMISKEMGDKNNEAIISSVLMLLCYDLNKKNLAIFYGKQSVNGHQYIRSNISGLNKNIKQYYLGSQKHVYRLLAYISVLNGRLSEAQQVVDMLKEYEFFEFILGDRSAVTDLSARVDYSDFERQWLQRRDDAIERLMITNSKYQTLKLKKNEDARTKRRLQKMELRLKVVQRDYKATISQMKKSFEKHQLKKKKKLDANSILESEGKLQAKLKKLDRKRISTYATLHYLIYKGRISIIVTTSNSQCVKHFDINEKELNLIIVKYRNIIMKPENSARGVHRLNNQYKNNKKKIQIQKQYEEILYNIIFRPVDEELKHYRITNLMVSLDGVLRYVPLAALWDGENYLVQRFRIALMTPTGFKNIAGKCSDDKKILAMGASRGGNGFTPLPYVKREIRSIVKDEDNGFYGLITGKAFLDDDFTRKVMIRQLNKHFPLVHISSHFQFSPGDETKNHLLLGDGNTMKLSEIRGMGKIFTGVDLLVLSACQTAVGGNGEEIDGFGELAQQSGAKSVMASLWPVADESTKELMVSFYSLIKKGKVTGKIEALRQAQLQLAGLEDLLGKYKSSPDKATEQKTKYASSYYWGPFIMMGNGR